MAALGWLPNLDLAANDSEAPVGPGIGRELMLLYVGRIVFLAFLPFLM
jgi:hypothetical protein